MPNRDPFILEHRALTRRFFLLAGAGAAAWAGLSSRGAEAADLPPECAKACEAFLKQMHYLTPPKDFGNVSRGNPFPYDLPPEKKQEVGLTPETWRLEVVSDDEPGREAVLDNPLSKERGTALDWAGLMKLSERHAVSFPKLMTCNNIGAPLGMGLWEGVPLREVVWMTRPKEKVRRVFYHGYHNDDPKQVFRSSLPIGRVLEDPFGLPPVILCYKLNGQLLSGQRGGPVRIIVPEMYGYKSVKWLTRVVLSNIAHANDTYAEQDNDVDSMMKTFAHSLLVPKPINPREPIPITGYAQVGVSGLSRVQIWISPKDQPWPADDPYFKQAPWTDAHILPPPERWGGELPDEKLTPNLHGFDALTGRPTRWPMPLSIAHWAALHPALAPGQYILRTRSIDEKGVAQPMPRPFPKSGRNAIEETRLTVRAA